MLVPRYYFADMYTDLYDYFFSQPHKLCTFQKGDMLWNLGETIKYVYYIKSGITKTFIEHEDGHHKIIYFHSKGSVFPGHQNSEFKIEASIGTQALSTVETLRFTREEFYRMFQENKTLNARCFENYSMYINLLSYEAAHQEYNSSFIKVCNLLYLFSLNSPSGKSCRIELTQQDLSDILTISLVNVANNIARLRNEHIIATHRKWIEIVDYPALMAYCSNETRQD